MIYEGTVQLLPLSNPPLPLQSDFCSVAFIVSEAAITFLVCVCVCVWREGVGAGGGGELRGAGTTDVRACVFVTPP